MNLTFLQPCPLCGGHDLEVYYTGYNDQPGMPHVGRVWCKRCLASVMADNETEAVHKWNRRPIPPAVQADPAVTWTVPADRLSAAQLETLELNASTERDLMFRLDHDRAGPDADARWLALARTHMQQAFMCWGRAVLVPPRRFTPPAGPDDAA